MKLLIRGGSIAAGHGVIRSYVDILKEDLRQQGITVLSRARHRETSFDGIGTFEADVAGLRPDILLLHFGVADAFGCVYRSEFQENIVRIIRRARLSFRHVICLATAHTFDNPYEMDAVNIFYDSLRITASDLNCAFIPVHSYWAEYLAQHNLCSRNLVLADPRYPNPRGHEVIAAALGRWLEKICLAPPG